ncbi:hypothetical protein [Nonomuraea sp. NEAU-A123]|uniref:hypothetical protein n=1 Tax=Nonomuraea sp. NEAU-A123 TaxID=2839649 RepID=UPI001BE4B5D6|nr:hypothetical protein [Nonomuraea sp. NEAU-A123]MBT2224850.1 hypothetical protein [Nonomuraea sp. NEAU-A123]
MAHPRRSPTLPRLPNGELRIKRRDFETWRAGVLVPRCHADVTLLTIKASPQGIHHLMRIVNPAKLDAFERSHSTAATRRR